MHRLGRFLVVFFSTSLICYKTQDTDLESQESMELSIEGKKLQYYVDEDEMHDEARVLVAQGKWVLFSFPRTLFCEDVVFKEQLVDNETGALYSETKECFASERRGWYWLREFTPGTNSTLHYALRDKIVGPNTTFDILPEAPPNISWVDIRGGAGWLMVSLRFEPENYTNLVGFGVVYQRNGDKYWWRSELDHVTYNESDPYVRPVHFCPLFRENGTLCILLSDGVWFAPEGEKKAKYKFKIWPFRINPEPRRFRQVDGQVTDNYLELEYQHKYCDWLKRDCYPPIDKFPVPEEEEEEEEEKEEQEDEDEEEDEETEVTTTNDITVSEFSMRTHTKTEPIKLAKKTSVYFITTTQRPDRWLESNWLNRPGKLPLSDDDLLLISLAVLTVLTSIFLPCGIWLGRRAGQRQAAARWRKLSTARGNVNIPLNYITSGNQCNY